MLGGVFSSPSNHWIWVHPWCHNVGWPWWWISSSPAQTSVRRWPVRQLLLRKPTDLTTCSTWSCWSLKMRQVNKGKEKKQHKSESIRSVCVGIIPKIKTSQSLKVVHFTTPLPRFGPQRHYEPWALQWHCWQTEWVHQSEQICPSSPE